jgi:hypothetical protein
LRLVTDKPSEGRAAPSEHSLRAVPPSNTDPQGLRGLARVPLLLLSPKLFFAGLSKDGALFRAIFFGVLCTTLGLIAAFALGPDQSTDTLVQLQSEYDFSARQMMLLQLLAIPAGALLELVLYASLVNLVCRLFRVENSSLGLNVKLVSYSMISKLLLLIPVVGALLSMLGLITLLAIALHARYALPLTRSVFIAAIPVVFLSAAGLAMVS